VGWGTIAAWLAGAGDRQIERCPQHCETVVERERSGGLEIWDCLRAGKWVEDGSGGGFRRRRVGAEMTRRQIGWAVRPLYLIVVLA